MTENIEIVETVDIVEGNPRIEKIKAALKKVDPKVYAAAAVAAIGTVGYIAYKRIENFEEREAARMIETETIDIVAEV